MHMVSLLFYNDDSNETHIVWGLPFGLGSKEPCVYIGNVKDLWSRRIYRIDGDGRVCMRRENASRDYAFVSNGLRRKIASTDTVNGLYHNDFYCRQVYIAEAEAATVAFLIMTTVWKQVPIHRDIARHIAKMIYNSHEDTVWENVAPFIVPDERKISKAK